MRDRGAGSAGAAVGAAADACSFNNLLRTPWACSVSGLAPGIAWQDVKDFMRSAGDVVFADCKHYETESVAYVHGHSLCSSGARALT